MGWTQDDLDRRNREVLGVGTSPAVKQNKYRVSPKAERTVGLLVFASKAEAHAYQTLLILQETGQVTKIELQPVFKFPMKFEYRADFRVTYRDGSVEVIDVKGMETPVFKLKAKCMEYFYPEVKVELWKRERA